VVVVNKHHTGCRHRVFVYGRPALGAVTAHSSFDVSVLKGGRAKMAESFGSFLHENHFPWEKDGQK
jgi:hypothetical protein